MIAPARPAQAEAVEAAGAARGLPAEPVVHRSGRGGRLGRGRDARVAGGAPPRYTLLDLIRQTTERGFVIPTLLLATTSAVLGFAVGFFPLRADDLDLHHMAGATAVALPRTRRRERRDRRRTSIILGPLRLRWMRVLLVAAVFGFWDAVAPLLGLLFGNLLADEIGEAAEYIGPATLALFGVFLLVQAYRHRDNEPDEMEESWTIFGLPLPLSIDDLVGGTGLGLLGFNPWISALVLGLMTIVLSVIGLLMGRLIARLVRLNLRYELLTGAGLLIQAIVLTVLAAQGIDV
ncbi:manganese efflux pump [Actinomycetospora rhizophila]|uniref:Manganese efflux pump n=1 Tax=Actinomycetospora rhizophila TaxID=1416876 RepID=A0ABV9Z9L0_9PSEU